MKKLILFVMMSIALNAAAGGVAQSLRQVRDAATGAYHSYQLLQPQGAVRIETAVERPAEADGAVLLCVAGAFTLSADQLDVCGDHVVAGRLLAGYDDVTLTGWLLSDGTQVTMGPKATAPQALARAQQCGGYLLQQCYIVQGGTGHPERIPQAILSRRAHIIYRAACLLPGGAFAVVQGVDEQYPEEFVRGLVALGVREALYLDMGTWAYGWWRSAPGRAVNALALHFDHTAAQSNWLVLRAAQQ